MGALPGSVRADAVVEEAKGPVPAFHPEGAEPVERCLIHVDL